MHTLTYRSSRLKQIAQELGFEFCGISKAGRLSEEEERLDSWLKKSFHGSMKWMENNFDKRLDPTLLVENAKSVVSLLYNYYPEHDLTDNNLKVAKYAYGNDYHDVIRDKLKLLLLRLKEEFGSIEGRAFVDSAPVMERAWAAKSGLGWIGKHSLLITKKKGSYYFIAELIIDLELESDGPTTDHCGDCTACIDACPTDAIVNDRIVDSTKCISYLTIELKDQVPKHFKDQMKGWVFGCDICQDVCPWNRFSHPHQEPQFASNDQFISLHKEDWQELTEDVFKDVFKKSALKRAGYMKLKKTIELCS